VIAHHASAWGTGIELGAVAVVGGLLALVWWRGRHRERRRRPPAAVRD
jgi:ABC-type transport system involved in cytochrome c biogenesis permease subunit